MNTRTEKKRERKIHYESRDRFLKERILYKQLQIYKGQPYTPPHPVKLSTHMKRSYLKKSVRVHEYLNLCTGASKPLWGKATTGKHEGKNTLNHTFPVKVERLVVFKFATCDPSFVFRAPSLKLDAKLMALSDFPVCDNFAHGVFLYTIHHYWARFCQCLHGILCRIVRCERFYEGCVRIVI